jgi:hypothetical protein
MLNRTLVYGVCGTRLLGAAVSDATHGLQFDFSFLVSGKRSVRFDDEGLRAVGEVEVTIEGQGLNAALFAGCVAKGG